MLKISHLTSGAMAVLVGYTSSIAIIFQAIDALGATQAQANSWILMLGLGMGLSTLYLAWTSKMPILAAWSTPAAALVAFSSGLALSDAIGAFLFCALLLTLTGVSGLFGKLTKLIPDSLANAMLAGILFRFGLEIFPSLEADPTLVIVMALSYLAGKRFFPRFAIPAVLLIGSLAAFALGRFAPTEVVFELAMPVFMAPSFDLTVLIGLGLPMYIVTMSSQNMPGVVTLRSAGYEAPVDRAITVTGVFSLLMAPFGGYTFNLAAITAAITAGPDADEDPSNRYKAALVTGVIYCIVGVLGATVISLFLVAPKALVLTIAGLALLGTIGNGLAAAVKEPAEREAALVTFMTTVSGMSLLGIGAPFWALLFGLAVRFALRPRLL